MGGGGETCFIYKDEHKRGCLTVTGTCHLSHLVTYGGQCKAGEKT